MRHKNTGNIIDVNDLKLIWKVFAKNWYIIAALVIASAAIAYIYTYKLTDIYAGSTQILLKSADTYDYQSQLYKGLGYYGAYEDISNQQRVITSYNLIERAISKLELEVSYYIIGRLKTTEVYDAIPFKVILKPLNIEMYEMPVNFNVIDEDSYKISFEKAGNEHVERVYNFDEEVHDKDFILKVERSPAINKNSAKRLKETDYFFKVHSQGSLIAKYKNALQVENLEFTSILQLTLEDEIPERAVTFLDTLSLVYIEYTLQSKVDVNENTLNYIELQLKEAVDMMAAIEDDLEDYRSKKAILNLTREEQEYFDKLMNFDSKKRQFELQLQSIKALEEYIINSRDAKESRLLPPSVFIGEDDDFLKKSINELYTQQININNMLFNTTEHSSTVKQHNEKIEFLRKDILVYLSNSKKAIAGKINDLKGQIRQYEDIIKTIPKTERDILNINRQLQVNEKMYLYLLEKKANTIIARAGIIPETKIIEAARSIGVVKPNKAKIMNTAILIGFVLSLLIIFIRSTFYETIENAESLKAITALPIFGEVILADEAETEYVVVENNPKAAITESFRSVRTNLDYIPTDNPTKVILVTSHNPNEGKTFCSINLAAIIAKAGKKVLLLELDLHKPKIYQGLKMKSDVGISSVLAGKAELEEAILPTGFDNLDVMLSGPTPPNASELILSNKLQEIIKFARLNYDYVIIDTPPIGLISDALVMMKDADATLFVLNPRIARREYIKNAEEVVAANGVKNFGFVLNGVKLKKSKYYYNYSYGYK
nr:polysaccharide biosynthesis tyrosine autokinase [Bacteroidota bacterium]